MSEPDWIEHDGSAVCPVPAGHDVEVRFRDGRVARDCEPTRWFGCWMHSDHTTDITHCRDWTAFEEQQRMSKDDVPGIVEAAEAWRKVHSGMQRFGMESSAIDTVDAFFSPYEPQPNDPFEAAVSDMLDFWDNHTAADGDAFGKCVAMLRARLTNAGTMKGE